MVPKLLKDHKAIMESLVLLESELKNEGELNIEKLENLLMTHKKYEEEHFYPKLDQELDDSQKKDIIGRIEEQIYF